MGTFRIAIQPMDLGNLGATPGFLAAFGASAPDVITQALRRHMTGDWGEAIMDDDHDRAANEYALTHGLRVLSRYTYDATGKPCTDPDHPEAYAFYVITEADRSATTFLLCDEY